VSSRSSTPPRLSTTAGSIPLASQSVLFHLLPFDVRSYGDALISVNRTVVGIKCKDGIVLVRLGSYFYTLFSFKVNGAPLYVLTGL